MTDPMVIPLPSLGTLRLPRAAGGGCSREWVNRYNDCAEFTKLTANQSHIARHHAPLFNP
jgi:hypothetical protein